jgi:murein endopeptidase
MRNSELLSKLEEIVDQLGLELRWDEGDFTGGICRLGDRKILVMNRSLPTFEKIRVLCQSLSRADLSRIFVLPAIREQIVQRS